MLLGLLLQCISDLCEASFKREIAFVSCLSSPPGRIMISTYLQVAKALRSSAGTYAARRSCQACYLSWLEWGQCSVSLIRCAL